MSCASRRAPLLQGTRIYLCGEIISAAFGSFFPVLPVEMLNGKPLRQCFGIHTIQAPNIDIDILG
jgi:hypothetical protein